MIITGSHIEFILEEVLLKVDKWNVSVMKKKQIFSSKKTLTLKNKTGFIRQTNGFIIVFVVVTDNIIPVYGT